MSPVSDAQASDHSGSDKTPSQASPVKQWSASPLASGSDEDDKNKVKPPDSAPASGSDEDDEKGEGRDAVLASGGSSSRHSYLERGSAEQVEGFEGGREGQVEG